MGFTPDEAVVAVDFTGTVLDGLNVKIKDADTDTLLRLVRDAGKIGSGKVEQSGTETAAALDALLTAVAEMIVEWDLEVPAGTPLPPTREVLGQRSFGRFTLPLVNMCIRALNDVGGELGKGSDSGRQSLAGSIPMAPL